MADEFDRFLAAGLAVPERDPDRGFVRIVQARIALEQRLAAERSALLRGLAVQVGALAALAAGMLLIARAPAVADFTAQSPAVALAGLLAGFSLWIALIAAPRSHDNPFRTRAARRNR
jgi:hypothetical protein